MLKKTVVLIVAVMFVAGIATLFAGNYDAVAQSCKKMCSSSAAFSTYKKDECKTPCAEASKTACAATCKTSGKASCAATCMASSKASCTAACKASCADACKGAQKCCPGNQCDACRKKTAEAIKSVSTDLPYHESKRLVLTGEYVCGKCTLSKMEGCQGFFKTAQGDMYPLMPGPRTKMMGKIAHKQDKNKFEIAGRVRVMDGVKYIDVTSVTER